MRKSRYVSVLLAGAAAVTLAGCDESPNPFEGKVFGDVATCSKETDAATCEKAEVAAKEEHAKQAPKFATKEECEAAGFAQCETAEVKSADGGSHSMFMPMMMGFMMGQMMGGNRGSYMPPTPGTPQQNDSFRTPSSPAGASKPVYSDRNGYLYAGNNQVGRVAPGTTSLGGQSIATRMTSRGGFGASGARYSSGGS
jgi:uncharacterized protein YgiB involved in biofilm formation